MLLVHEWWGLNDQIKSVAAELARQGYLALALDLYDGRVATTREDARAAMRKVAPGRATDTVASWARWLKVHAKGSGKVGTVGWCFGGGWSLNTGIAEPVDATVVYYGLVNRKARDLAKLRGPVLGHFAERDGWIDRQMVGEFEGQMKAAGKEFTTHWYDADHAFANPTSARLTKPMPSGLGSGRSRSLPPICGRITPCPRADRSWPASWRSALPPVPPRCRMPSRCSTAGTGLSGNRRPNRPWRKTRTVRRRTGPIPPPAAWGR